MKNCIIKGFVILLLASILMIFTFKTGMFLRIHQSVEIKTVEYSNSSHLIKIFASHGDSRKKLQTKQRRKKILAIITKNSKHHSLKSSQKSTNPKQLLMYTKYFKETYWWGFRIPTYDIEHCKVNKCIITHNKNRYASSDAVIFHARDLPDREELKMLRQKPGKQLWIWHNLESPMNLMHSGFLDNGLFDWTSTYRTNSDIFTPYFRMVNLTERDSKPKLAQNFAQGKNRLLLIMMGNCIKERIDLLKEVNKHVNVDLYGNCVTEFNPKFKGKCQQGKRECDRLKRKYKFYFVFENSYCDDYVTEKFYANALISGLVPVVIGGDYLKNPQIVPRNSYINLLDFNDLKSLGDYLNYLDKNDTAYNEYHQWRYHQKVEWTSPICNICEQLWKVDDKGHNDGGRRYSKARLKISEIWDPYTQCKNLIDVIGKYL